MFRFSRPPENLHYFPLSAPNRLVIDITGSIEALPQVATYKADDPQIESVRVSSAAGRMRLIIDLALDEIPAVSVDTDAAILMARIGQKHQTAGTQHADAQILFIAENADLTQLAQTPAMARSAGPFSSETKGEPTLLAPQYRPLILDTDPSASSSSETDFREEERAPEPVSFQPRSQGSGKKISLHLKDADIRDALRILANVSGFNIVATDDVTGRVTLRLVDVPWDHALTALLRANGLERVQSGNIVIIVTAAQLEAERSRAPLETAYVKVSHVKATDIAGLIGRQGEPHASTPRVPRPRTPGEQEQGAQVALLSPRGTVVADRTSNVIIIRDVQENIEAVRELIRQVDTHRSFNRCRLSARTERLRRARRCGGWS